MCPPFSSWLLLARGERVSERSTPLRRSSHARRGGLAPTPARASARDRAGARPGLGRAIMQHDATGICGEMADTNELHIEITPEMIRAGGRTLADWTDWPQEMAENLCVELFNDMLKALNASRRLENQERCS